MNFVSEYGKLYQLTNDMKKVLDFLTEVRLELAKVVWPDTRLTIKLTVIVILVTITVGFFIGGIDYILTILLDALLA